MKLSVVSHVADLDGVASAVMGADYLLRSQGITAVPYFASYENALDLIRQAAEDASILFITDLSLRDPAVIDVVKHVPIVLVVDHHRSSDNVFRLWEEKGAELLIRNDPERWYVPEPQKEGSVRILFDPNEESCTADLLWQYLSREYTKLPDAGEVARLFEHLRRYTHSQDLWVRDEPNGEYLTDAIRVLGARAVFDILLENPARAERENFTPMMEHALEIARTNYLNSQRLALASNIGSFIPYSHDAYVYVFTMLTTGNQSEIGHEMLQKVKFGYAVMVDVNRCTLSLRSTEATVALTGVGVDAIAKHFVNGGGHRLAAGASLPTQALTDILHHLEAFHERVKGIAASEIMRDEVEA